MSLKIQVNKKLLCRPGPAHRQPPMFSVVRVTSPPLAPLSWGPLCCSLDDASSPSRSMPSRPPSASSTCRASPYTPTPILLSLCFSSSCPSALLPLLPSRAPDGSPPRHLPAISEQPNRRRTDPLRPLVNIFSAPTL
jgi:hypothetical protein